MIQHLWDSVGQTKTRHLKASVLGNCEVFFSIFSHFIEKISLNTHMGEKPGTPDSFPGSVMPPRTKDPPPLHPHPFLLTLLYNDWQVD